LLTSITNVQSYTFSSTSDYDFSAAATIYTDQSNKQRAFSQELRVQTQSRAPVNYMLGLYYQRNKLDFAQGSLILGSEDSSAAPPDRYLALAKLSATRGETRAVYGQALWAALPGVEVAAGARYTDETKRSFFVQPYVNSFFAGVYALGRRIDSDQHFSNLSPEATLTWKPAEDLMVYGAWKQGYKSGGFSNGGIDSVLGSTVDTFAFRPETVRGLEAGIKATLLDQRLRVNLAAYRYAYSDLQLEFFNAPTVALVTTNIGSATTKGMELDAEFLPPGTRGLRLHGAVQYNLARYRDFVGPCYAGQTLADGCNQVGPPPTNARLQDLSGKRLAGAPKWTGTLGFDDDRTLANGLMLGVSAAVGFSSRYSVSPVGQPLAVQPGHTRLDAGMRLLSGDRRFQWALIGKNLTNRFVVSYANDAPFSGSPAGLATGSLADQIGVFLPPRTIELQFSWRH
jgi:iron complex outermembrane recepter protein